MPTDLRTYFRELTADKREALATECRVSVGHIRNVAYGDRTASPDLAVCIERESEGRVLAEQMLPAKWTRVRDATWPHPQGRPCLDPAKAEAKAA